MKQTKEDVIRERQVPRYIGGIKEDLEEIENAVSVLRDNLTAVLKDNIISQDPNEDDDERLVPFACELRDFHHRMKIILSTISYMNEALEL